MAVSPGLVPSTNLATDMGLSMDMPDAKTISEGEIFGAMFEDLFPKMTSHILNRCSEPSCRFYSQRHSCGSGADFPH